MTNIKISLFIMDLFYTTKTFIEKLISYSNKAIPIVKNVTGFMDI